MDLLVFRQVVQPVMELEAPVLPTPTVVVGSVEQAVLIPTVWVDSGDQVDQADQVAPVVVMPDHITVEAIILVDQGMEVVKAVTATILLPL